MMVVVMLVLFILYLWDLLVNTKCLTVKLLMDFILYHLTSPPAYQICHVRSLLFKEAAC